jgi:uncharacterized cupredoxin-like copper-binding protein
MSADLRDELKEAALRAVPRFLMATGILMLVVVGVYTTQVAGAPRAKPAAKPVAQKPTLPSAVTVSEGDMFLRPVETTVAAGKVSFSVTNEGMMQHEFVIVSGDPTGTTGDEPGRVSEANHIGGADGPEIGNLNPGQTKTLTATLAPGTYTAMCNLASHFAAGMEFTFVVQ